MTNEFVQFLGLPSTVQRRILRDARATCRATGMRADYYTLVSQMAEHAHDVIRNRREHREAGLRFRQSYSA